jgi:IS30 family transposase
MEVVAVARPSFPVEWRRRFWSEVGSGRWSVEESAVQAGVSPMTGLRWFRDSGGVNPYPAAPRSTRSLSFSEREEIAVGLAAGRSRAQIARDLGRHPATIGREIARNSPETGGPGGRRSKKQLAYRAGLAQSRSDERARRPKLLRIPTTQQLRGEVQSGLDQHWSPEQISNRLRVDFPDDQGMQVSHETIYKTLYVQGRGQLRRELVTTLRTGRALRKPHRKTTERRGRIPNMINISDRPAEVADRAVPGHWEGDLIIGANSASAIGTLVERSTRFTLLLHLPDMHGAEQVRDAMTAQISRLPTHLAKSVTWDQGIEMVQHAQFSVDTGVEVYFCDPHSPWQRGTNENTNGLLRQYFPKGTSLKPFSAAYLDAVAEELNARPRKTLAWRTPAEALTALLSTPDATTGVIATTS